MTVSNKTYTLGELNYEEAKQHVGGVVFIAVLMVIGFVGNLHVLFVYAFRMKPSNHRTFILVLGIMDFISCTVGMPFIIMDLRNPLTFTISSACKLLRFVNYFNSSSSALMLLTLAIERYRKICVPHGKQITGQGATRLSLLVLFLSLLMAWPAPVLFGITSVPTMDANTNGSRCSTQNKENYATYQGYYNAGLLLILLLVFVVLVVMYTLIWRVIAKRGRLAEKKNKNCPAARPDVAEVTSGNTDNKHAITTNTLPTELELTSVSTLSEITDRVADECDQKQAQLCKTKEKSKDTHRANKMTLVFMLITIVFGLSYFPHLTLKIVVFVDTDFVSRLSFAESVVYNTIIWCFFINNVANCFIYGFFDVRFRREISMIYNRILCRD